ncbi:MAG: BCCT family transporter [Cetobacterium sp.]|uniref:BCCT family transporter n=1 Tax=Cetobacterium sp. TaxID=2071632 RepID=UPI003F402AC9
MKRMRHGVFWGPFLLMVLVLGMSLYDSEKTMYFASKSNRWLLDNLSIFFSICACLMVITVIYILLSPIKNIKIGGEDAKPIMGYFSWGAVTLCTTIAAGLMFWGVAEPLIHYKGIPSFLNIHSGSEEAAIFSISTMYLHWTIIPYSIYSVPSLLFALSYYNLKNELSLSSLLKPILGKRCSKRFSNIIDSLCLYTLSTGMIAALGTGILAISGGIPYMFTLPDYINGDILRIIVGLSIAIVFTISAISGVTKGIKILSNINILLFLLIMIYLVIFGFSKDIFNYTLGGVGYYISNFFKNLIPQKEIFTNSWYQSWTVYYWGNWLAWAPVTAIFLGKIARGRTIREFMIVNFIFPCIFSGILVSILGGTSIGLESMTGKIYDLMSQTGIEVVAFEIFKELKFGYLIMPLYMIMIFISFVTAADSNISVMGAMSCKDLSIEDSESPWYFKLLWGGVIGIITVIMINTSGIEGLKMISNLGAIPALILEFGVFFSIIKVINSLKEKKVEKTSVINIFENSEIIE